MKIPALILNCLAAAVSMIICLAGRAYCSFGNGISHLVESDNKLYSTAGSLFYVGIILAFAAIGLSLLSFFKLRKNKTGFYVLMEIILFVVDIALNVGAMMGYTYVMVKQIFWTGTFMTVFALAGVILSIAALILAMVAVSEQK